MSINTELHTLTQDLYYMSESDYPWEVEEVTGSFDNLPAILEEICRKKEINTTVTEERSFADFFGVLTEVYPGMPEEEKVIAERYAQLYAFLVAQNLQQSAVIRVGEAITIEIFVLAITSNCDYIVLHTTAIET